MSSDWTFNKFASRMNDTDPDFHVIGAQEFCNYLQTVDVIQVPQERHQNVIDLLFAVFESAILNYQEVAAVPHILRSFVLLSKCFPIESLKLLFQKCFQFVYLGCDDDVSQNIAGQILVILREILSVSISYEEERQKEIKDLFLSRILLQLQQSGEQQLTITLNLCISLLESIGSSLTEENIAELLKLLEKLVSSDIYDVLTRSASNLKFLVRFLNEDQIDELCQYLFKLAEDNKRFQAYITFSEMIQYEPMLFVKYVDKIFAIMLDQLAHEERQIENLTQTNPDIDITQDTTCLDNMSNVVNAISGLIVAFPEETAPFIEKATEIFFTYICYNSTVPEDDDDDDNEEGIDGTNLLEDGMLDEDDVPINTGDDSFKVRKASLNLMITLMKTFPDYFYSQLLPNINFISRIIRDYDQGVKVLALDAFSTFIEIYLSQFDEDMMGFAYYWINIVGKQIKKENLSINPKIIHVMTQLTNDLGSLPVELSQTAVSAIFKCINEASVVETLTFILTITQTTEERYEEIAPIIASIFTTIIGFQSSKTTIPTINAASRFFSKLTSTCEETSSLVKTIISIVNQHDDSAYSAIEALAVYCITLPSAPETPEAVNTIIASLSETSGVKSACAAIALISASPSHEILKGLIDPEVFKQKVSHTDLAIVYRALWAISLLLTKGLVQPDQLISLITPLSDQIVSGDSKCKLLSLQILNKLPNVSSDSLPKIQTVLTSNQLPERAINACANLLITCAQADLSSTQKLISTLISHGAQEEESSIIIARVIGNVGGHIEAIGNDLLSSMIPQIVGQQNVNPFYIRVVGELGSLANLSGQSDLISSLFQLINSEDRSTFSAAADALGCIAAGSSIVLKKVIETASSDAAHSSVWILSLLSCARKVRKVNVDLSDSFDSIVDLLMKNADYKAGTAPAVAESLSNLVRVKPEFADVLLENAKQDNIASPVLIRALSIYANSLKQDELLALIEKVMAIVRDEQPELNNYALIILKTAFKFPFLYQRVAAYFNVICHMVEPQSSHRETVFYGSSMKELDLGRGQRQTAVDLLIMIIKRCTDVDDDELLKTALVAITDRQADIKASGLGLLTQVTIDYPQATIKEIEKIADCLNELDAAIFDQSAPISEAEIPFMKALAAIKLATDKNRNSDFEHLFGKHEKDQRLKKCLVDIQFAVAEAESANRAAHFGNACYDLMQQYCEDAAGIFSF